MFFKPSFPSRADCSSRVCISGSLIPFLERISHQIP